jgi:nucleoside-diphosphate-sugar epimerase
LLEGTRPDWIFHLAAAGGYSWQRESRRILETNVLGTAVLLGAAVRTGFEALVNAGSSSEYGFKDHPANEAEVLEPNSVYGVGKAAATSLCRQMAQAHALPVTTLRLYSVYGPWEEPRRLIPTLIVRGHEGTLPPLVAPDTARDFVYVDDAVDAFLLAAGRVGGEPGAVYNVGSGVQTTLRELVELTRGIFGLEEEPRYGTEPPRSWDTSVWVADAGRIRRELGWRPAVPLVDGLRRTAAWLEGDPRLGRLYHGAAAGAGGGADPAPRAGR